MKALRAETRSASKPRRALLATGRSSAGRRQDPDPEDSGSAIFMFFMFLIFFIFFNYYGVFLHIEKKRAETAELSTISVSWP